MLARFIICTISGTLGSICLVSPPRGLFTRSSQAGLTTVMVYCTVLLSIKLRNFKEVMNASARLVYCAPKYCHVTPFLRELHWLPVRLRVDFKILLVTFKILHGVAPSYLKDLVSVLPDSRYQLRRNNNGILLERPRLRTKKTLGDRALSMAAPFLWNSLPLPIRQETSIDSFKRSVKTYLFKKAFSWIIYLFIYLFLLFLFF